MRYDRARRSLDRHATYIVATFVAGASRYPPPICAVMATPKGSQGLGDGLGRYPIDIGVAMRHHARHARSNLRHG
jgi:hypothetical protein